MESKMIKMVMVYANLILGTVDDNEKMPLPNNDLQFSSVVWLPTEDPVKDTRSGVYLLLGILLPTEDPIKDIRSGVYLLLGILSMFVSMKMKTQVDGQIIKHLIEVLSSFKDHNFQFVTQSANQFFISIAIKLVSVSDCMEWFFIPLNLIVNVSNDY